MNKARKQIINGVNKLNNIVKITIGPKGRNVIIDRNNGSPLITNDGVTIAKYVELPNRNEKLGADVIKQASIKTNEEAGDGTTSAIVLSTAIINNAEKEIRKGNSPIEIKESLLEAAYKCINILPRYSHKVYKYNDLISIATNSSANKKDGEMVAKALSKVGADGLVSLETNKTGQTKLSFSSGVKINMTTTSPYFTDTEYYDAKILIAQGIIKSIKEIINILEYCIKENHPLVLIANDFVPEVINALILNRVKSGLRVIALKTDELEDASVVTGATLISPKNDLTIEQARPEHLGFTDKIIFAANHSVFIKDNKSELLDEHIKVLQCKLLEIEDEYSKTRLRERIANLTMTAAVISVGCPTDAETMEKRMRIEDAIAATTNAMKDGIVQGGGLTYIRLACNLKKNTVGERILKKSLYSITDAIMKNSPFDKSHCDIIDASTIIQSVIRNSVSAAAILITTDEIISSVI